LGIRRDTLVTILNKFNATTILIVDDDPSIIMAISKALDGLGRIVFAIDGASALKLVASEAPDIILLDVEMPGMSGFEVCDALQAKEKTANIPIIFITSHDELGFEEKSFSHGATDFISKPLNHGVVTARAKAHIANKKAIDRLQSLSLTDSLTGLNNRRSLDEKLVTEWQHAKRNGQSLSLLMLDIDEFKKYNDHFGHLKGDNCIKNFAEVLTKSVRRPADFAARYGGEEFVIILPDTEITGAHLLGENIIKNIIKQAIPHAPDAERHIVTLSIGCCTFSSSTNTSPESLLETADKALYLAKQKGRCCISIAEENDVDIVVIKTSL
jgi:diguanylate cyclase (GGDEF)-like protein